MKTATVLVSIGTRPEAIKLSPVVHELRKRGWADVQVLTTAQHREMLDQALDFFGIEADIDLDLMREEQGLVSLTSRMLPAVDEVMAEKRPDFVLVQGDTTTTMVMGLCCHYRRITMGHVEAGLRSGDRRSPFPEEMNRRLLGHLADLHFAPTVGAREHLIAGGIPADRIHVTGNTVIDALRSAQEGVDSSEFLPAAGRRLILVTVHRREALDGPLEDICQGLLGLAERSDVELLCPVHPNPVVKRTIHARLAKHPRIRLVEPLDYPRFIAAMKASYLILTDSGGVQEEAPSLGKPVLVLRDETERYEGIKAGAARLVGRSARQIQNEASRLLDDEESYARMAQIRNPYGDGRASPRICDVLEEWLRSSADAGGSRSN